MTDKELKAIIDKLWEQFWSSGISNPLSVIEQMTYLIFYKMFEQQEDFKDQKAKHFDKERKSFFEDKDNLRWSRLKQLAPEEMLVTYRDKVFPFLRGISPIFNNANCLINKASLLDTAIQTIDDFNFTDGSDAKGDIFEYMLARIASSGENGQFRTPRHVIDMMVKLVEPTSKDKICDPACGTGGFLCSAYHYILEKGTSKEGKLVHPRLGDLLNDADRANIDQKVFYGYDFDATMHRIGTMNLILHNIRPYNLKLQDTLSKDFDDSNKFDVVLANPPFTGSIDENDINSKLRTFLGMKEIKSTTNNVDDSKKKKTSNKGKTELLFMALFLRILDIGGRGAVIVPSGVLSTESNAHKTLRTKLIENNQLEAVISMPSGVFRPYAGVATAVLIFTKDGQTENVWFYEMANDGYSLDDKRNKLTNDQNDIPDIVEKYKTKAESEKSFNVTLKELQENDYNLLPSKYKKVEYKPIEFKHTPQEYIEKMLKMEKQAISILENLKEKVGGLVNV